MLSRAMTSFQFGVEGTDLLTPSATSLVMLAVGCLASFIPTRRIVRIDPLIALRADA